MHIEHKQFLDLIADASGIDLEKAEKQLSELVSEIKQSLSEGEAYEIEGFGIFSSLGNRIMFIPSDELETEVNFKYVGMEPIELDEPKPTFEDPFAGLDDDDQPQKSLDARFAGLIDDDITDPLLTPEENPGPETWGVQAHKEDEGADRLFASLMGEEYEPPIDEPEGIDTSDTNKEDDFSDVFAESDGLESSEDLGAEVAAFMTDDPTSELEESATEDLLDDIFADNNDELDHEDNDENIEFPVDYENFEEELEDAAPILNLETASEPDFNISIPENDNSNDDEIIENELEAEDENEIPELEEHEDFDDPFFAIEEEQFDESVLRMEDLDETEIVPVIKNITTDAPEPEPEKEKSKKELLKEEKEQKKLEKELNKQEQKEAKEKAKAAKKSKDSQQAPTWLWIVLLLVIVGGGVVGLGYFSIINIPFITPQTASTPVIATPTQQETAQVVPSEQATIEANSTAEANNVPEQANQQVAQEPQVVVNVTTPTADQYGLSGQVSAVANDGYTIILYTLSNQANAINEAQKLIDAGYRGFLTPVASERFGTLYRVSLGQFNSLFDAAVAAEEVENLLPDNYIIKKIN